jgi:Tfp pilus assembly protein PilO
MFAFAKVEEEREAEEKRKKEATEAYEFKQARAIGLANALKKNFNEVENRYNKAYEQFSKDKDIYFNFIEEYKLHLMHQQMCEDHAEMARNASELS